MKELKMDSNPNANFLRTFTGMMVITVLMLSACSDSGMTSTDNDNDDMDPIENGGDEIGSEPVFTNIQAIFEQNCASCHIGSSTNGVRLDSYENVIESVGDQYGTNVVQPGDADNSPLVDKIEPNPQFGNRMPQGGPFLSQERIDQIRSWINQGAENN
ncbi:MAG TPA: cytochrome c [Balneolaceae bacterium]|nr:cytochrome c [Balneolaceae bacterium]